MTLENNQKGSLSLVVAIMLLFLAFFVFNNMMKSCNRQQEQDEDKFDVRKAARAQFPVVGSPLTKFAADSSKPLNKKDSNVILQKYLGRWNDSVRLSPFNDWLKSGHIYSPADYERFQQILQAYINECYQKDASKIFKQ